MRKPYDPKHLYERCHYRGNLMTPSNCSNGTWAATKNRLDGKDYPYGVYIFICENCYNKYKQTNNLKWTN